MAFEKKIMDTIIVCSLSKYADFMLLTNLVLPLFQKNLQFYMKQTFLIVPHHQVSFCTTFATNYNVEVLDEESLCPELQDIKPYYRQMYIKLAFAQRVETSPLYLILDCDVLCLRRVQDSDFFYQDKLVYCHNFLTHPWHKQWQEGANQLIGLQSNYDENNIMGMTPQIFKKQHVLGLIIHIESKYKDSFFNVLKRQAFEYIFDIARYHRWTEYTLYWSYILYANLTSEYIPGCTTTFWDHPEKDVFDALSDAETLFFVPQSNSFVIDPISDIHKLSLKVGLKSSPIHNLKIALLLTGDIRTFDLNHLTLLKQRYNLDVFGFAWNELEQEVKDNLAFTSFEKGDKECTKKTLQMPLPSTNSYFRVDGCAPIENIINQIYTWKQGMQLIAKYERNHCFKYDIIIRTRFDYKMDDILIPELLFAQLHPKTIFIPGKSANHGHTKLCSKCNVSEMFCPSHTHKEEICDMFCLGSRNAIRHYCSLHDVMYQVYKKQWNKKNCHDLMIENNWPHLHQKDEEWIVDAGPISETVACFHPEALLKEHLFGFQLIPSNLAGTLIR
jgi:hypothetical protein